MALPPPAAPKTSDLNFKMVSLSYVDLLELPEEATLPGPSTNPSSQVSEFFLKDFLFIYLFMRDTERERGRDTVRGRSRLHAGSPMWDSILGSGSGLKAALNR